MRSLEAWELGLDPHSMLEACQRYRLSPEEFLEWERQYKAGELTRPRASPKKALH